MRAAFLAFVSACAAVAPVDALPEGAAARPDAALVAGRLAQDGTRVGSSLRLRDAGGREVLLRLDAPAFVAAVPPGTYEVTHLGSFAVKGARPRVDAAAGRMAYLGSLSTGRLADGELPVTVADARDEVLADLRKRHGDALPEPATDPVEARVLTVVPTSTYYDARHYKRGFHYADRRSNR